MREEEFVKHGHQNKRWSRLLRPIAIAGLSASLVVSVVSTVIAQDPATPGGGIAMAQSPVALHDGSCADPVLEPEFELGTLEEQEGYADAHGLIDNQPSDIGEGDLDGDSVLDTDEEGFLAEDVDADGVLDEGEDLNDNGVLDAGVDENDDGILDPDEIIPDTDAAVAPAEYPTVWKVDEEVDATFEELFGSDEDDDEDLSNPGVIAIHQSPENYGNIVACAELAAPGGWEDRDTVVLGLTPGEGSNFYGYAVFERDTGNIPVFGENTTGVTVYVFEKLPTLRDTRTTEGTPES